MLINSFQFAIVFPIIFVLFWIIPYRFRNARNLILLIASYLLYMNCRPSFAVVLMGVTVITYFGGAFLQKHVKYDCKCHRKHLCWLLVILSIFPLLIFKYYHFINENISLILDSVGLRFSLPGLNWGIPVGISFFTFQAVGYLLDVYHRRINAEKNFLDYSLFVSFFPQVTSGPISTAKELIPQIKEHHPFCYKEASHGFRYILWGLFLKSVIADRAGIYVDTVCSSMESYSGINCLLASFLYTLQIYTDFAGYSLMAVGVSSILGFRLVNNFKRPYFATSVTDFWKRWHISLTKWLTTHIYINLGGNRCSKIRQYYNILVTFLVSGIWHGANWTFIIWGMLHGLFQVIEKALWGDKIKKELRVKDKKLTVMIAFRIIVTFVLVNFAWIFFRMPTLEDAAVFIKKIILIPFGEFEFNTVGSVMLAYLIMGLVPLMLFEFYQEFRPLKLKGIINNSYIRWGVYLYLISSILLFGVHDNSQFIYVSF